MELFDFLVLMVAGGVGAVGSSITIGGRSYNVAWLIVGVWALWRALRAAHVLP